MNRSGAALLLFTGFLAFAGPAVGQQSLRVAGIEVGSKSVKVVVLPIAGQLSSQTPTAEFQKTIQTNLTTNIEQRPDGKSWFNDDAITRTAEAVAEAYKAVLAEKKGDG